MSTNKFMGTFDSETDVLRKIEELKSQGITEDHMYVMAHDKDQISMVRGRTDVDYKSSEGSWKEKFMGFLSGNEPVREAFSGLGLDKDETDRYYHDVQNGKILLFVDQEIGDMYENNNVQQGNSVYGDPMNATTGEAGYIGSVGEPASYGDSGIVARDGLTVDTNESNDINYHRTRGLVDSDDIPASRRLDDEETAGVGHNTGTGFGLGPGVSVDDEKRREGNDFTAANELKNDGMNRKEDRTMMNRDRGMDDMDREEDRTMMNRDRGMDSMDREEDRTMMDRNRGMDGMDREEDRTMMDRDLGMDDMDREEDRTMMDRDRSMDGIDGMDTDDDRTIINRNREFDDHDENRYDRL